MGSVRVWTGVELVFVSFGLSRGLCCNARDKGRRSISRAKSVRQEEEEEEAAVMYSYNMVSQTLAPIPLSLSLFLAVFV